MLAYPNLEWEAAWRLTQYELVYMNLVYMTGVWSHGSRARSRGSMCSSRHFLIFHWRLDQYRKMLSTQLRLIGSCLYRHTRTQDARLVMRKCHPCPGRRSPEYSAELFRILFGCFFHHHLAPEVEFKTARGESPYYWKMPCPSGQVLMGNST